MSKEYPTMHAKHRGGWTDWCYPMPGKNYKFKCCDCGLVHEMQFGAFAEADRRRGLFKVIRLPWPIRAMFRARRAR